MTSFALLLGVIPWCLPKALGAPDAFPRARPFFGGMIAATTLNLFFIPVLYAIVRSVVPGGEAPPATQVGE